MADCGSDRENGEPRSVLTERLVLKPLGVSDAEEMFPVLDDVRLHTYIGGVPSSLEALEARYTRLEAGSSSPGEEWVNWIVRLCAGGAAIGTVQATIVRERERRAEVAWVIGVPWQRQGYASEAAGALVAWLRRQGIERIQAHIHPDHQASAAVARHLGMQPTTVRHEGEILWEMRGAD